MRVLNWNVRGLGNSRTFLALQKILQQQRPQILFVSETKLTAKQMSNVSRKLKIENCLAVDRKGMGGRLAMLWNSDVNVNVTSFSNHHIDAQVQTEGGSWMRCTGIYGHPEMAQKKHTWTLLRWLAGLSDNPWLCFGDFNEILHPNEKIGGNDRNIDLIREFREALCDCNLVDLGCKGYLFTWNNGRFGKDFV